MRPLAQLILIVVGSVLLAFALLSFAYGIFLQGGEENAPQVGGWLIGLGVLCAAVGSFLLVRFSRHRL